MLPLGKFSSALRSIRNGVLGVLEVSHKDAKPSHPYIAVLGTFIRIYQLFSFVTSSDTWPPSLALLDLTSGITNLNAYRGWLPSFVLAGLVWGGYIWVGVLFVLMVWGVWSFAHNSFLWTAPLKVLGTFGELSSGILYIPLLQIILQTDCSTAQGMTCTTFGVVSQLVISIAAATFLTLLSLLFKAVFYKSSILSKDLNAQAHGRLNIAMLILQLTLVITINVIKLTLPMERLIILTVVGILWLFAHLYFMSYFSHTMNRVWVAGAVIFLCGVIALAFNVYVPSVDAALLLYTLIPFGGGAGIALADWRANSIVCSPYERLSTPYEIELKARYTLSSMLWGHPLFRAHLVTAVASTQPPGVVVVSHKGSPRSATVAPAPLAVTSSAAAAAAAATVNHDDDAIMRLTPGDTAIMLSLFRTSSARFVDNSIFHLFCARMYGDVLGNRHMQMSHLLQADRCSPAFDVTFTVFQTRRALENDTSHDGKGSTSAITRIELEKHAADARRNVQRAAQRQLAFWSELTDAMPDVARLHRLARETNEAVRAAEANFVGIFALSPQALTQLRLCAAFHLHVTGNVDKATVLLGEAERLEDTRSKDHRSEAGSHLDMLAESTLDVWSDNTAIVTTSSNPRDFGVIQSLNSSACKLFGYARVQLERRSIFTLMPAPFDRIHEDSLRQYCSSGEAALGIVDFCRTTLVFTKQGTVIPVLSSFKDAPIDEGPSYIWALRELRTDTHLVVVDGDGTVLAVSAGTQAQWGIDPDLLSSRAVIISHFLSEWGTPELHALLTAPGGAVVDVVVPMHGGSAARPGEHAGGGKTPFEMGGGNGEGADGDSVVGASRSGSDASSGDTASGNEGGGEMQRSSFQPSARHSGEGGFSTQTISLRCRLQRLALPDRAPFFVLHWQRLSALDLMTRMKQVAAAGAVASGVSLTPPLAGPLLNNKMMRPAAASMSLGITSSVPRGVLLLHDPPAPLSDDEALGSLFADHAAAAAAAAATGGSGLGGGGEEGDRRGAEGAAPLLASASPASASKLRSTRPRGSERQEPRAEAASFARGAAAHLSEVPGGGVRGGDRAGRTMTYEEAFDSGPDINSFVDCGGTASKPKTKSVGSRGSASSVNNTLRSINRLRRIVTTETPPMLPSLTFLRVAGIAITVLAVGLAIVVATITNGNFALISLDISFVVSGSKKMVYKASAILAAQDLILDGRSWVNMSDAGRQLARVQIAGNTSLFTQAHLSMASYAQSRTDAWQWTTRYITLSNAALPANGVRGATTAVNLIEAGSAFGTLMSQLASSTSMTDAMYQLYSNGCSVGEAHMAALNTDWMRGGTGHETLDASIQLGFASIMETIDTVSLTQLAVFIGMLFATFAVASFVFIPIIHRLDRAGDMVMLQFISIPLNVRRLLQASAAKRVRLLRRDYAVDEDDDDDDDEEEEEEEGEGEGPVVAIKVDDSDEAFDDGDSTLKAALGKDSAYRGGGSDSVSIASASSASSSGGKKRGGGVKRASRNAPGSAPFRKSNFAFFLLVLRFVSPLFLLIALFSTVYGCFIVQATKTRSLVSLSVAAGVRASCGRQAMVDLRKLEYLTTDAAYITRSFFFVMSSLDCVRSHTRLLAYGTVDPILQGKPYTAFVGVPESGAPSYLSPTSTTIAYNAMFGDACPFLKSVAHNPATFNLTACGNFGSGVLSLGLAAAVEAWWQTAYIASDRQLRGIFTIGQLYPSVGWSLPSDTFNYSTVVCDTSLGCAPNAVVLPLLTGSLPPTWMSDPLYIGDMPPGVTPGDNVFGPTGMTVVNGSVPYSSAYELSTHGMDFLLQADAEYLTPGLLALAQIYADDATTSTASFLSLISYFIPLFMTTFALIMSLWFLPETVRENKRMQTKRAMLLYLPPVVVSSIKSIRNLIDDICASEANSLGGGSTAALLGSPRSSMMQRA